jgi:hypothetical protein
MGLEAEGPSALMRAGIKNNALQPGDLVTVTARPRRDGRPAGAWVSVTKGDGTILAPRPLWVKVSLQPHHNWGAAFPTYDVAVASPGLSTVLLLLALSALLDSALAESFS